MSGPRRILARLRGAARFFVRALAEMRGVWQHPAEILRQTSILLLGTSLILVSLMLVIGGTCGIFGNYFLRTIGATDFVGAFTSLCGIRAAVPIMFGYVLAAKVGCGLVAEIGSMRINEELEAFESVGLDPMRFVVATRLAAAWLFIPVMFPVSALAVSVGSEVAVVTVIGEVSEGSFASVHWGLQSLQDQVFAFVKVFVIGTAIVLVATYYGYRQHAGPAGVGSATARSMIVNLVLIHFLDAAGSVAFYGTDPRLPIGG